MTQEPWLYRLTVAFLIANIAPAFAFAQQDPLQQVDESLKKTTGGKLYFTLEERTRWEEKFGVSFGKAVNQQDMLSRFRIGMGFDPTSWISFYAMGQDARVPFYGAPAPNTMRDTMDLQEAYVKLFDSAEKGFGAAFGRSMLDYGDSRVIGTPQWSNIARTYDQGRLYYRNQNKRLEVLMVSPVKVLPDSFNKPELGERIWGTYDSFLRIWHGANIDVYGLRHSQNKIGGWTGAGTLGTNSFGGRLYGPLPLAVTYSLEGIGQTGHLGLATQQAYAWFAGATKSETLLNRPVLVSAEFKAASGTRAGATTSGTYDQLSPANHDKFGHEDLFGWRNLKTFKSLETWNVTKVLAVNLMYTNDWLFSAADALYNSQGSSIAVSKSGTAGKVNAGSQEQAQSINHIASAITQMEETTQSAAASAQESAAAAEEVASQCRTLRAAVERLNRMFCVKVSAGGC